MTDLPNKRYESQTLQNKVYNQKEVFDSTKFMVELMKQYEDVKDTHYDYINQNITFIDTKTNKGYIAKSTFKLNVKDEMKDKDGCLLREVITEIIEAIPTRVSEGVDYATKVNISVSIEFISRVCVKDFVMIQGKVFKLLDNNGIGDAILYDPYTNQVIAKCQCVFVTNEMSYKL
ncbi:UNKNOWN [Stylonychia lemnae]|uniref:Thioesterase domain-containing protein n=1 Tax=Stylonychia lemnae TaxID=5949 RepID=A0A077ZYI9_STYLE|nr:UNKNOWN [Stylonychia lemnae]|eukprot:CDW74945.1 UNKNOWN [Stylonychia lemnae]